MFIMDDIIKDEVLGELEYQEVAWVGEIPSDHIMVSLYL